MDFGRFTLKRNTKIGPSGDEPRSPTAQQVRLEFYGFCDIIGSLLEYRRTSRIIVYSIQT